MTEPGIYLVNSTGAMTPLLTESEGVADQPLYHEAHDEQVHPCKCPNCGTTIRSTGGSETLYETDDEKNAVVLHNVLVFTEHSLTDDSTELWYCPNEDCRVHRLETGND
jgi:hypothetical protein